MLTDVDVRSIEKDGAGFTVQSTDGAFSADAVVLAAGWRAAQLAAPLGIVLALAPARGQIIITEPLAPLTRKILVGGVYIRQTGDGTFQIGSHVELVGPRKDVTFEKLRTFADAAVKLVPFFRNVRMLRAYAGLRPLSADGKPMVGEAPGMPGLVLACGHSTTGVMLAPLTGKSVCELVMEGRASRDISPWDPARFEGKGFQECHNES